MSSSTSGKELTPDSTSEETAAKTAYKRYEALMTVRTKALKGKGAWYWTHLQPILIVDSESNAPKAVKLRCSLCDAVFSASNPSRTASEHLKRGTCPNFSSSPAAGDRHAIIPHHQQPKPISAIAPASSSRKRSGNPYRMEVITYSPSPSTPPGLSLPSPQQPNMVLSGGKGDLGSLAMLEDSVKQLDPATGKMRIANPQSRRLVWETCLNEEFGSLAKVAARLIFLNATAGGFKCNPSLLRWLGQQGRSTAGMERAQKMIFIAAQSRLERRDFSGDEAKDVRLFANGDVDELNETFMDASS
ncbi:hypothetical protein KSP40_PGU013351 [Platanthera guangdongensis]|uniref:DUF7963 domain-containing protein n=1 Tax=Platanthera guangdongensis TaxID=2320717 RepID=A0ABR2LML4_9ASPA